MMEYKGYFAKVEFDDDDNIFHGEVINLRDVITFEGETVIELKKAFKIQLTIILIFVPIEGRTPKSLTLVSSLYALDQRFIRTLQ
jgi:predicted HicB family RNase H-like nuclease